MKSIAVFCGSSTGHNPTYKEDAKTLGAILAERDITLIYGGAKRGIMKVVADSVLQNGGRVIGVIPRFLVDVEVAHRGLTELIITRSMHERKLKMFELSDGFAALPGGIGTLEELFEVMTWAQLNLHKKAIAILNSDNYYRHMLRQLDHMVEEGLLKSFMRSYLITAYSPSDLIEQMSRHDPGNGNLLEESLV